MPWSWSSLFCLVFKGFLLDERTRVAVFQEQLGNLDIATAVLHSCILNGVTQVYFSVMRVVSASRNRPLYSNYSLRKKIISNWSCSMNLLSSLKMVEMELM